MKVFSHLISSLIYNLPLVFNYTKYSLSIIIIVLLFSFRAQEDTLMVIVHEQNDDVVTSKELGRLLKGQTVRWKNGKKVSIGLMKTSTAVGAQTAKEFYNMNADQLNKYWLSLVFQGKAKAPEFFVDPKALIQFVANHPGAIGIIPNTDLTGTGTRKLAQHAD